MPTAVSRNTIKLSAGASSATDYYVGYDVKVSRLFKDGRERIVKKSIIAYNGSTKVATIDGLWDSDFIPGYYLPSSISSNILRDDTFELVETFADSRVTTNTAIQSMDYITSNRYGRGLDPTTDLDIDSWLEAARDCDTQSDVTVEVSSGTLPGVGAIYRYPSASDILFQGTVSSVYSTSISGVTKNFVKFTSVIGKLTNKWNSWKSQPANAIVYNDDKVYISAGGIKTVAPTHTSGTVNGLTYISTLVLTKVSGTGGATLTLPCGGNPPNPVRGGRDGAYTSGYSLYDADDVNYWRYQGWDEHSQRYVTRHQTNLMIDTSQPLFDNMNSLLEHFGGMLRYNAGKYYLEVEQAESAISNSEVEPRNINYDYIIGSIKINDDGIRSAYNSLTVAYADPANKFEAKNISFFNSAYLKADKNVAKKGNLSIPGITNYYNARLMADKFLTQSRYGLTVSLNIAPRGVLLLAGRVIQLNVPRYNWISKKFRIENLTHNSDCSVDIVATEYDDSFYAVAAVRRQPMTGVASEAGLTTMGPPTNLRVTADTEQGVGGIELIWINDAAVNASHVTTEIYSSYSPNLNITITAIASNIFTSTAHGLINGQVITAKVGLNGLEDGKAYYVRDVTTNSFKLAATKNGAALVFTDGAGLDFQFMTATIIANVPAPENTYFDPYLRGETDQTVKYYWIRYKVTQ
jgi:hypothetical protein